MGYQKNRLGDLEIERLGDLETFDESQQISNDLVIFDKTQLISIPHRRYSRG